MRTRINDLFDVQHPIVLAPMSGVAGGAHAAAVTRAGGLGLIGCGYGDPKAGYGSPKWIAEQFDIAADRKVGAGFITWSLARRPELLDLILKRGADGVLLGTRFFATSEALGSAAMKRRIVEASGDDTVRTRIFDIVRRLDWPEQYTGRALVNSFTATWHGREAELTAQLEHEAERYQAARMAGDLDTTVLFAGEGVGLINDCPSAGDVIDRIMSEAKATCSCRQSRRDGPSET